MAAASRQVTLCGIPAELRLMIYDYVLVRETPITFEGVIEQSPGTEQGLWGQARLRGRNRQTLDLEKVFPGIGLLLTCRLISSEAIPSVYEKNSFEFSLAPRVQDVPPNCQFLLESFRSWRVNIGPKSAAWLRKITFVMPNDLLCQDPAWNIEALLNITDLVTFQWDVPNCGVSFRLHSLPDRVQPNIAVPPRIPIPYFDVQRLNTVLYKLKGEKEPLQKHLQLKMLSSIFITNGGVDGHLEYNFGQLVRRGGTGIWRRQFSDNSVPGRDMSYMKVSPILLNLPSHVLHKIYKDVMGPPRIMMMRSAGEGTLDDLRTSFRQDQTRSLFRRARGEPPSPVPEDLMACKTMFASASIVFCHMHTYVLHQTITPNGRGVIVPASWMADWIEHNHTNRSRIGKLKVILDISSEHLLHLDDVRICVDEVAQVSKYVSDLSFTVRLRGSLYDCEHTFSFSKMRINMHDCLASRLVNERFFQVFDKDMYEYLWFELDAYGAVRAIHCHSIDRREYTAMDANMRLALEDMTSSPGERVREESLPFLALGYKITPTAKAYEGALGVVFGLLFALCVQISCRKGLLTACVAMLTIGAHKIIHKYAPDTVERVMDHYGLQWPGRGPLYEASAPA